MHTGDVCIPLGVTYSVQAHTVRAVLDFLVTRKAQRGFTSAAWTNGVRFEADDMNWGFGSGPEVVGPAQILALAIAGRRSVLDRMHGPGVDVLNDRT